MQARTKTVRTHFLAARRVLPPSRARAQGCRPSSNSRSRWSAATPPTSPGSPCLGGICCTTGAVRAARCRRHGARCDARHATSTRALPMATAPAISDETDRNEFVSETFGIDTSDDIARLSHGERTGFRHIRPEPTSVDPDTTLAIRSPVRLNRRDKPYHGHGQIDAISSQVPHASTWPCVRVNLRQPHHRCLIAKDAINGATAS